MSALKEVAPGEDLRFKYEVVLRDLNQQREIFIKQMEGTTQQECDSRTLRSKLLQQKKIIKNQFEDTIDQTIL